MVDGLDVKWYQNPHFWRLMNVLKLLEILLGEYLRPGSNQYIESNNVFRRLNSFTVIAGRAGTAELKTSSRQQAITYSAEL